MPTRAASRRLVANIIKNESGDNVSSHTKRTHDSSSEKEPPLAESQAEHVGPISASTSPLLSTSFTAINSEDRSSIDQAIASPSTHVPQHDTTSKVEPQKKLKIRAGITRKTQAEREGLRRAEEARRQERLASLPTTSDTQGASQGTESTRANNRPQRIRNQQAVGPLGSDLSSPSKGRSRQAARAIGTEEVDSQPRSSVVPEFDTKVSKQVESKTKAKGKERARPVHQPEDKLYVSSGDENNGQKRRDIEDIERIVVSSDEDGEILQDEDQRRRTNRSRSKYGIGLRPVRVDKEEHIARPVRITADSKRSRAEAKQVKLEKDSDENAVDVLVSSEDHVQALDSGESVSNENEIYADEQIMAEPVHSDHDARTKIRKTKKRNLRYPEQAAETLEERQERDRVETDLVKMREIWEGDQSPMSLPSAYPKGQDTQIDPAFALRNGQVFLMQFPPMTPMLIDPVEESQRSSQPEPREHLGQESAKPEIKRESRHDSRYAGASSDIQMLTATNGQLPSGLAGKLNVHRSGKVTMNWGGTDMIVGWGTEVNFLQDLVLTGPAGDSINAEAYSLAQLKDKLVVTPDWQKIYE